MLNVCFETQAVEFVLQTMYLDIALVNDRSLFILSSNYFLPLPF